MPPQTPVATPPAMPGQPLAPPPQPQPQNQPMMPQPPQQPVPPPMQLNPAYGHDKLAIASLVLGIISLPTAILTLLTIPIPIIGMVLGFVSLKRNKGLAAAGIILSSIGLALSVILLVFGIRVMNSRKAAVNPSSNSSTSANASNVAVTSNCYTFDLPGSLTTSDITNNEDCVTKVINASSTEDVFINSGALVSPLSGNQIDAYLTNAANTVIEAIKKNGGAVTSQGFTTLDGARAYKVTATENDRSYKYAGFIVTIAPKDYVSVSGAKLRSFIIGYDSATSQTRLDEVAKSWHWQ